MQVSTFSIVFMAISAIISIGLPIGFYIFIYKKYNAKFIPMIIGAVAFILFALVLERSVHLIVFKMFPLREKPLIYILYGIFMAGIFEETARLVSFKILKRKYTGIETGLSYGIGHGGTEAILIAGISMIVAIVFSVLINTGNTDSITGKLQGEALTQINAQINTIIITVPYMFLISGIERFFAIIIQISLSVIMFYSVYCKGKIWLFPLAIILHAIIDIPAAAMQVNVFKNILFVECLLVPCTIIITIIAFVMHKKFKDRL
jgi:uncharacterized membrane protein YhfC